MLLTMVYLQDLMDMILCLIIQILKKNNWVCFTLTV